MKAESHAKLAHALAEPMHDKSLERLAEVLIEGVSTAEILKTAMLFLNIKDDAQRSRIVDAVSAAAESSHPGDYHTTAHFRDVTASGTWLLSRIPNEFTEEQKFFMLVFFALHDYRHDGGLNKTPRGYERSRLEEMHYEGARQLLEPLGFDEKTLDDMHALFLATDVSQAGPHDISVAERIRLLEPSFVTDKFNIMGGFGIEPVIAPFMGRPDLHLMARIAQAADLMPSAALSFSYSVMNSQKLECENGTPATKEGFAWFSERIAHGTFMDLPKVGDTLIRRMAMINAGMAQVVSSQGSLPRLATCRPRG